MLQKHRFLRCFRPFGGKKNILAMLKNIGFYVVLVQEGARNGKNGILRSFQHRWPQHSSQEGSTWANIGQHRPNIGPTWAQDGPNIAQHGPNLAQHRPKIGPTWLNMGPTWPNISPRWAQDGSKWARDGPTCAQHRPRLLPYRQALRIIPASIQHSPPWVCAENLGPIFPHHKPKVVAWPAPGCQA